MGCKASFLANSTAIGKKNNVADRPIPADHRPQEVMQRVPRASQFNDCWYSRVVGRWAMFVDALEAALAAV